MAKICGKWRIYLGIDLSVWERPKYVGNDVDLLGNGSNVCGNDLLIWQTS